MLILEELSPHLPRQISIVLTVLLVLERVLPILPVFFKWCVKARMSSFELGLAKSGSSNFVACLFCEWNDTTWSYRRFSKQKILEIKVFKAENPWNQGFQGRNSCLNWVHSRKPWNQGFLGKCCLQKTGGEFFFLHHKSMPKDIPSIKMRYFDPRVWVL